MSIKPEHEPIVDMLHDAFTPDEPGYESKTLLGAVGAISSVVEGDVLILGSGPGDNRFHAVPLDLASLSESIDDLCEVRIDARLEPQKPEEVEQYLWDAMSPKIRAIEVSERMRPEEIGVGEWNAMSERERATVAMLGVVGRWNMLDTPGEPEPFDIEKEDLAILARIMSRISPIAMNALVRAGYDAAGPKA
jgi:hypothetical protein